MGVAPEHGSLEPDPPELAGPVAWNEGPGSRPPSGFSVSFAQQGKEGPLTGRGKEISVNPASHPGHQATGFTRP